MSDPNYIRDLEEERDELLVENEDLKEKLEEARAYGNWADTELLSLTLKHIQLQEQILVNLGYLKIPQMGEAAE